MSEPAGVATARIVLDVRCSACQQVLANVRDVPKDGPYSPKHDLFFAGLSRRGPWTDGSGAPRGYAASWLELVTTDHALAVWCRDHGVAELERGQVLAKASTARRQGRRITIPAYCSATL